MADLNKVFLMGNLTRDPEMRYLTNGTAVASFGLAMNRTYITQNGERKEDVCFVRIVVFGKQAESCGQYLTKGRLVFVEGRLQYRTWESEGQKRSALDVVADRVQFLGPPVPAKTEERPSQSTREETPAETVSQEVSGFSAQDEDLPF